MSPGKDHRKRHGFGPWERLQISTFSLAGWVLVRAIGSTLRYRVEGWENFQQLRRNQKPIIFVFWHNQIFFATHFWRSRGIVVMTSRHFDGEAIARIIQRFGFGVARGSSTRGGAAGLLALKRNLDAGVDVAFTADGPRGPRYRVKPGPLWLSGKSEAPILPFHLQPRRFWSLKSWDHFRLPKPFSEVLVKIGTPIVAQSEHQEEWRERLQKEMDRIGRYGRTYWATPRRRQDRDEEGPGPEAVRTRSR